METTWTTVTAADDVTEEVLDLVRGIESGWYNDSPIDWEDVWDRLDGATLSDGSRLDMGGQMESPAMRRIQSVIRKERRQG